MIRVHLSQCSYSKPGGESHGCFNQENFKAETLEEAMEALKDDYGIVPPKRPRGVYVDGPDGNPIQVGFMHYRWENDWSHGTKAFWVESWVSFTKETLEHFSLPKALQAKP